MDWPIEWLQERGVSAPGGFQVGAARGGIKTSGPDVMLLLAEGEDAKAAGVFTQNQVKAAPVWVSARHLANGRARAVVVNAGNANCCTGAQGEENARRMTGLAAQKLGLEVEQVLVCSTGIIGHQLPMDKVEDAVQNVELGAGSESDEAAARAIMTTDIVPKYVAAKLEIDGQSVTVGGMTKGVGMIGPDMAPLSVPHATLLAFLTTDAQVEQKRLQKLLEGAVARSFNSVTVDGDTSTNDTALLFASGASGVEIGDENEAAFAALLGEVCIALAKKIARDGEGATKLVEITVSNAASEADAKKIALTIANSPLVKTAVFGRDPNWGRIAMAAGRAGVEFDPQQLSFCLWGWDDEMTMVEMFHKGEPVAFDQSEAERALENENVGIRLNLRAGSAEWTAWTCDFSYDYVKINAEYHT